jgi:DNA-binding PadR family transcriptional regulator
MARKPNSSPQTRSLLAAMARRPRTWHYGYQLSRETGLSSGTLYPILIRLSDQCLLESDWHAPESPGKPPRHTYRLTPSGLAFARSLPPLEEPSGVRQTVAGATA